MSKIIGLMTVRNEEWILPFSLRAALMWVDEVVLVDHQSIDSTPEIIEWARREWPGRIHDRRIMDPEWNEMDHRQHSLELGRSVGGTHFAVIDADEALTSNIRDAYRECLLGLDKGKVLLCPMVPVWRSPTTYRVDPCVWTRAWPMVGFADSPRMCWRTKSGYQFHHRTPYNHDGYVNFGQHGCGGMLHYQFADYRRLQVKHAWYKMMERVKYPDKSVEKIEAQYSVALDETGLKLDRIPPDWLLDYVPYCQTEVLMGLRSWHYDECERMWAERGPAYFAGLNLFGVVQ